MKNGKVNIQIHGFIHVNQHIKELDEKYKIVGDILEEMKITQKERIFEEVRKMQDDFVDNE